LRTKPALDDRHRCHFSLLPHRCVDIGQFTRLLPALAVVAVSQAPLRNQTRIPRHPWWPLWSTTPQSKADRTETRTRTQQCTAAALLSQLETVALVHLWWLPLEEAPICNVGQLCGSPARDGHDDGKPPPRPSSGALCCHRAGRHWVLHVLAIQLERVSTGWNPPRGGAPITLSYRSLLDLMSHSQILCS